MQTFWRRIGYIASVLAVVIIVAPAMSAPALAPWGGGPAPGLALKDLEGRAHDLAAYRGKVVLVNFWATWCEPCRQEMPSIQRLSEKLAGKPFVVLAVNVDEPESRVRNFLNDTRFDLPVLLDANKSVTRQWGARILPVTFIIGPDGRVRYRLLGEMDWSSQTTVTLITALMAGG
ncbi:MAG: TlpA family protein disulfide reductase [Burkholderiales bacterium]